MAEQKMHQREIEEVQLVRILGKDIPGTMDLFSGLTRIKGISWAFSHAICICLELDKQKLVQDVNEKELQAIENFVTKPDLPGFIQNRQKDFDEGTDTHLLGADLSLRNEFDVKRLKKIKSYRGTRHSLGLPARGQRTRSNFRKNRRKSGAVGVKKKK